MTNTDLQIAVTFLKRVVAHGAEAEQLIQLVTKMENEIEQHKRNRTAVRKNR
jgi:hypothetical protein